MFLEILKLLNLTQDKNSFRRRIVKRNLDIFQLQRTSRNSAISTLKQKMPIITKSNEKEVLNNCVHPGYKTSFFILLIFGIGMTILSCFLKLALIKGLWLQCIFFQVATVYKYFIFIQNLQKMTNKQDFKIFLIILSSLYWQ